MATSVRIEAEAWNDFRFLRLARACGFAGLEHALIMVAKIWAWQTENYTPEKPTYVVDGELIDAVLGEGGAAALVRCQLADEMPDGFFMHGTIGKIEWLWKVRQAGAKGSRVAAERASLKHALKGTHVGPERNAGNSQDLRGSPPGSGTLPQTLTPSSPTPTPRSESDALSRARDPSRTEYEAASEQALSSNRGLRSSAAETPHARTVERLRQWAWNYAATECSKVIASGIPGASAGAWGGQPGLSYKPMQLLAERVEETLVRFEHDERRATEAIQRRVDNAIREAGDRNDSQYLVPARMWRAESFAIAVDLDGSSQRARSQPRDRPESAIDAALRLVREAERDEAKAGGS